MSEELKIYEYAGQVQDLFNLLNQEQIKFSDKAKIGCLSGCGKCCNNPEIEISPLETYPWVMETIKKDETEKYLTILSENIDNICIFYLHNPDNPNNGYCGNYELRPLLCRLFGCSVLPDKHGNPRPVLCKLVKEADPELENRVNEVVVQGVDIPVFNDYYTKLAAIDPFEGNIRKSINQAFYASLQKISYLVELEQSS